MTRIKQLRKFFNYTQEHLAKLLHVSRSTVAMWETTNQSPDYGTLSHISQIFNIPPDFVMGTGIFSKWDDIIKYYDSVVWKLREMIPPTLTMPSFCEDKYLVAWLDTRLYFEPDEMQLARWFAFAVQDISITPSTECPESAQDATVEITFTPEFEALIRAEREKKNTSSQPSYTNTKEDLQAAFWGGEKDLSQEELDAMWNDVERFAAFLAEKKRQEKKND